MDIIPQPGLIERLSDGFVPFTAFFEFLPDDFKTVIVAAVALMVLIGIFNLLSR